MGTDDSARGTGRLPPVPMIVPRAQWPDAAPAAPRRHAHLSLSVPDDLAALTSAPPSYAGRPVSVTAPASLLRERYDALRGVLGPCGLLFIVSVGVDELLSGAEWPEISAGRVVVVESREGLVCYIDSIPTFACGPGDGRAPEFSPPGAFEQALLDALTDGAAFSTAVVIACHVLTGGPGRIHGAGASAIPLELLRSHTAPRLFEGSAIDYLRRVSSCIEVVEASAVYALRGGSVLMAEKLPRKAIVPGLWYLPGGKAGRDESPEDCARRELFEETGLAGDTFELLGVTLYPDPRDTSRLFRFYQYILREPAGAAEPRDDIISCEWVPLSAVNRSQVFEPTWAGLFIGRFTGAL